MMVGGLRIRHLIFFVLETSVPLDTDVAPELWCQPAWNMGQESGRVVVIGGVGNCWDRDG